jgi:hypothetical protein
LNKTIESIEGKMPIVSKRTGSQSTISRQQQSIPQDNQYDEYVYYPYYSKSTPNHDYGYRQESRQYEQQQQQPEQSYQTRTTTNSGPVHQT